MTEIYCVSCGEFVMGQDLGDQEGICKKCQGVIEEVAESE